MEVGLWIDIGLFLALAGAIARVEFWVIPRIRREGRTIHSEASAAVVQDTKEQYERIAHLIKNHIEGPAHRR